MKKLRLGTRKSALAQAQAKWVAGKLRAAFSTLDIELVLIMTSGDASEDRRIGGSEISPTPRRPEPPSPAPVSMKALFTKEIEEALLDNKIDLAVHSLKDMAADLPKGLVIGAIPEREDPRDVWISKNKVPFDRISKGMKIGTGAVRRQAQVKHLYPLAELVAIRGNVDTRLRKLAEEDLDGLILALAGLKRLGREKVATDILSADLLIPAVGQGCLAIQVREDDGALQPLLKSLDDAPSHLAAIAERAFLRTLGGSCQTPIAGHAQLAGQSLVMVGVVLSPDGKREVRDEIKGPMTEAASLGQALAKKLLAFGADKILG